MKFNKWINLKLCFCFVVLIKIRKHIKQINFVNFLKILKAEDVKLVNSIVVKFANIYN